MKIDYQQPICDDDAPSMSDAQNPDPTVKIRLAGPHVRPPLQIEVGEVLENCRLIAKLGSGSSGQAFLAREIYLGDRPIVLKVSPEWHEEHMNLARLQHTHIMPLFWARVLQPENVRVLAMPYLAKTTLADLLARLKQAPIATWTGARVLEVLQEDQRGLPVRIPAEEHPARALQQSSWVDFVVRIGRTLAETLAFAHQRNLLHLDVKPANIVMTPDGQPILLDLDVARPPIAARDTVVPWLGGTPAYMSPEQRLAMNAVSRDEPIPKPVDGRSDLYALGMVLFEALGGKCDGQTPPDARDLPRINPHVGRDLAEILARSLAENPSERYPDGNALAEDLDRYLRHLPLRGVRNRLPDRWRKWRRRRPLGLPLIALAASFCLACACAGLSFFTRSEDKRAQAEIALAEGQDWQRRGDHEAALRRLIAGQQLADSALGGAPLREQFAKRIRNAERLKIAADLKQTVHLLHLEALGVSTSVRVRHVLEAAGRNVWLKREILLDRAAGRLEPAVEKNIDDQLREMVVLWSDLQMRLAPATHKQAVRAEVIHTLDQADTLFGPSFGLESARAGCNGRPIAAQAGQPKAAWEQCALGRRALLAGDTEAAVRHFEQALERDPLGYGPNLHLGIAWMRQKQYARALPIFSYCLGRDASAECLLLRAQCRAGLGQLEAALGDCGVAIEKNASLAPAYELRADLLARLGRHDAAARDRDMFTRLRE